LAEDGPAPEQAALILFPAVRCSVVPASKNPTNAAGRLGPAGQAWRPLRKDAVNALYSSEAAQHSAD
jgi:hypothetical protein